MRRRLSAVAFALLWTSVAVLSANAIRLLLSRSAVASAAPFRGAITITPSYVELHSYKLTGNSKIHTSTMITGTRADGSYATRYELLRTRAVVQRKIRLTDGTTIVTNDTLQQVAHMFREPSVPEELRNPASACVNSYAGRPLQDGATVAGKTNILGYEAIELRWTIGTTPVSFWYAASLGCVRLRNSSKGFLTDAVVVRSGEPPAELFMVPKHYKEVPPEQINSETLTPAGK